MIVEDNKRVLEKNTQKMYNNNEKYQLLYRQIVSIEWGIEDLLKEIDEINKEIYVIEMRIFDLIVKATGRISKKEQPIKAARIEPSE